jgi:peptide/nickel transport system substrate-binding protein
MTDEDELRRWIACVRAGSVARRDFLARLAALGVAAPVANLLLAEAGLAQPTSTYKPTRRGGGGTLKLLFWQGPTLLNPHFANSVKDAAGSRPFYESLARFDADGRLVPILAAEIPSSDNGGIAADGRSTTWTLKRGVTWHDGKPFTAEDVIFNWRFATDPATAAFTGGVYENVKAIEKIDTHAVRIVFEKPTPVWTRTSNQQLIPQHLFAPYLGAKSRESPHNLKPVGTGPYLFTEFKPGDIVKGQLNPNYHGLNRPHFDAIEIKGGGDAVSAARAVLQTGEFDYAWNLQIDDELLKRMESNGKGRVAISPGGNTEMIWLNMTDPWTEVDGERASLKSRHPILSDPAVREALALLLDRKSVQEFVYGRTGVATANVLNNPRQFNSPNTKNETSLDKANALLDGAGWKRGASGIREKGGRKLSFVFQSSTNSVRQKVQAIYKQACSKAGIEVEVKAVAPAVYFSSDIGNPDTAGKFWADLQMHAFTRTPDPDRFMQLWVSWEASRKANKWLGLNTGRWANAEYDALFKAQQTELDPVKRAALLIRMNDLVCNDRAMIPVAYRPLVDGLARSLAAPLTDWDNPLAGLHDWYREG